MVKTNFIILVLLCLGNGIFGQRLQISDSVVFSGIVINLKDSGPLRDVTCRFGHNKATFTDETGRFVIQTVRKDTVLFSYVGFKPCVVVVPDTLYEREYMLGVFLTPDTLQLSEALIIRRFGDIKRQQLINVRNNMQGILRQAYNPVNQMDAEMNQRRLINEYARSIEMKGHVDVGLGVGTQSIEAYRLMRLRKKLNGQKERLGNEEVDMLKKLYYLEKKEKGNN